MAAGAGFKGNRTQIPAVAAALRTAQPETPEQIRPAARLPVIAAAGVLALWV
jgi:hypothetical protein